MSQKEVFLQNCQTGGLEPKDWGAEVAPGMYIGGWNPKAKKAPVIIVDRKGKPIGKSDTLNILSRLGRNIPEWVAEIYYGPRASWSFLEEYTGVKVIKNKKVYGTLESN